ncbi:DUF378 domain-containing protein [Desulforamulus hydrothermalis]|uniref:Uncharacterized membrane protein yuzA n=1 Tax=Desulforamulus hydrothermalis Lam5 = DSM 18033 TaxID=1121428 RepID=K8DY80_9FIRM|nr:DUF378 domain-containing protein [Desulforamulus hydrothermalis]CCO07655.1 Uncharacterized membrane protein yuzA [Desulforamulus hydrothermalis Lam5 = DSM 18033]SHH24639.1 hypothetical protein SAMN02745177_01945 [Desulforamulus hydrothermalis Lam5 = DSM 18033]
MEMLSRVALVLVIVGALNWLLVGLFSWDLVAALLGGDATRESSMLSKIIYSLIGVSGLILIPTLFRDRAPVENK